MDRKKIILLGTIGGMMLHDETIKTLAYHRLNTIEPLIVTGLDRTKQDIYPITNVLNNNIVMKMNHSYNTNLIVKNCTNKRNKFVNKPKQLRNKK